jgi:superfamily II DNA/RNA helicase
VKFEELDLHPALKKGIDKLGFSDCTDIQENAIPHILKGRDIAGLAQTGTGKTAAFLLPLMDRVLRAKQKDENSEAQPEIENATEPSEEDAPRRLFAEWKPKNFIMVLVPTRELADQVYQNIQELCPDGEITAVAVFGGTSYEKQVPQIKAGVDFIVATPGRLIDLYKEHVVDLKQVKAVVFDEADRMFDMGFKDDMKYILKRIDRERQFLVFSATLNFDVLNTAYEFGADPVEVNIGRDAATAENVEDDIFHVGHDDKPKHLLSLFKKHKPKQVIIFSNFKRNVERIALFLNRNGYPALGISSLLSQSQRNRVMASFKSDQDNQNILVATDVAARGLDVEGVDLVVNFEMPDDPENYVHRIGRTGRANAKGIAFSLVSDRDVEALGRIEEYTKKKLELGWLEDEFLVSEFEPFPRDSDKDLMKEGRSGPRDSKGRRGRKRKPNDGKRPNDRNKSRKKKTEDGPREKSSKDAEASKEVGGRPKKHRDRRTGRHAEGESNKRCPGKSKTEGGKKKTHSRKRNASGSKKAKRTRSSGSKRSSNKRQKAPAPQAQQSLGQKVGSFFRKVFGNG